MGNRSIEQEFKTVPFSFLDTRKKDWRFARTRWLSKGIKSELGRKKNLLSFSDSCIDVSSIFDPVLCEIMYTWFCPKNGKILDPFAGGSVRGIVAGKLGFKYTGIELRKEQVEENIKQAKPVIEKLIKEEVKEEYPKQYGVIKDKIGEEAKKKLSSEWLSEEEKKQEEYNFINKQTLAKKVVSEEKIEQEIRKATIYPTWFTGDAINVDKIVTEKQDFLFSCPPYYDLEVYSDLDGELSAMKTYDDFLEQYRSIIKKSVSKLNDNRFACFVVSRFRDKTDKAGRIIDFVGDTIKAFEEAGMIFYNDVILVNAIGSLPIRVQTFFVKNRKIGGHHQNVLIFYKGDIAKIEPLAYHFSTGAEAVDERFDGKTYEVGDWEV